MTPEELTPNAITDRLVKNLSYSAPEQQEAVIRSKLPQYIKFAIVAERERILRVLDGCHDDCTTNRPCAVCTMAIPRVREAPKS